MLNGISWNIGTCPCLKSSTDGPLTPVKTCLRCWVSAAEVLSKNKIHSVKKLQFPHILKVTQDPTAFLCIQLASGVLNVVVQIPRTQMTTIFEGQPPKTRPFPFETRAIWVPGIYISCSPRVYLFSCHCERCLETTGGFSSATSKGQDTTRVQRAESGIYEYVVS